MKKFFFILFSLFPIYLNSQIISDTLYCDSNCITVRKYGKFSNCGKSMEVYGYICNGKKNGKWDYKVYSTDLEYNFQLQYINDSITLIKKGQESTVLIDKSGSVLLLRGYTTPSFVRYCNFKNKTCYECYELDDRKGIVTEVLSFESIYGAIDYLTRSKYFNIELLQEFLE